MKTIDDYSKEEREHILKPRSWWDKYKKIMLSKQSYITYMLLKQHNFSVVRFCTTTCSIEVSCEKCGGILLGYYLYPDCNFPCLTGDELMIRDIIE